MCLGVFGQLIYIAPAYNMVVVKLSTWPDFLDDDLKLIHNLPFTQLLLNWGKILIEIKNKKKMNLVVQQFM